MASLPISDWTPTLRDNRAIWLRISIPMYDHWPYTDSASPLYLAAYTAPLFSSLLFSQFLLGPRGPLQRPAGWMRNYGYSVASEGHNLLWDYGKLSDGKARRTREPDRFPLVGIKCVEVAICCHGFFIFYSISELSSFGARPYVRRSYTDPVNMCSVQTFLLCTPWARPWACPCLRRRGARCCALRAVRSSSIAPPPHLLSAIAVT
ncbi:hypothetical protein JB92DRAFT_2006322 [Gautieria morchelliformis]|nr:hypothetical protein JB92DRAFT_2006322 [Gautieria morchelliformis]